MIAGVATAWAQTAGPSLAYSRANTVSVFAAYSGDSSHMLMGTAEDRRLLEFGVAYGRRLYQNRAVNWQYNAEILPVVLESDPVVHSTVNWTSPAVQTENESFVPVGSCKAATGGWSSTEGGVVYSYTYVNTCSRRWTMGEAMSPVGFQGNFRPRHKLQPFLIAHGGYMYTTQPIPVADAGSFNFTFDFGAGIELYRTKTRSVRAEYRFHHISNHNTANDNPGIDSGLFQVTYSFGR